MPGESVTVEATFEPLPTFAVTVVNGTANKTSAAAGETVTITANGAPDGQQFVMWTGAVNFSNTTATSTTFIMPEKAITVTAEYKAINDGTHAIIITSDNNGTASANVYFAKPGEIVLLLKQPNEGYQLSKWQVISGNINIKDNKFVMPDEAVAIRALFEPIPQGMNTMLILAIAGGVVLVGAIAVAVVVLMKKKK